MDEKIKSTIKTYQCAGCMSGHNTDCGEFTKQDWSESCGKHYPATSLGMNIKIFLGMPKGFNRTGGGMGDDVKLKLDIFKTFDTIWDKDGKPYDKFNVPAWKYLNKAGHTLVRGLSPRNNAPFLHVILEDCMDKIDCYEVTEKLMKEMD